MMRISEFMAYEFVQNAALVALLASLLCGLVGTFVVVKRLVFISGGLSHAAFGGLGLCHFLGLTPLAGAAATAVLAAVLVARAERPAGRSSDALIGILWAVGMALGVVFMTLTPGYAPNLTTYLFGDILAVSRPLLLSTAALTAVVFATVSWLFKELVGVAFDEEYARTQGLPVRRLLTLLMVLIALSVVVLIQAVGVILAIALLTIPPTISLGSSRSFRGVMVKATLLGLVMTLGGLVLSFAWNLPSGPVIVLLGFVMLLIVKGWRALRVTGASAAAILLATLTVGCTAAAATDDPSPGPAERSARAEAEDPTSAAPARPSTPIRHLEFLGQASVPAISHDGVPLGGISGLAYDARRRRYYALSDDRAEHGPARFYDLEITLAEGRLESSAVRVLGFTQLVLPDGRDFGRTAVDPEGIALTPERTLIISSEGDARRELPPFLREFALDGRQIGELPLSARYRPRRDAQAGVRNNLAFESAAVTEDGRWLFTVTENALAQDGPISTLDTPSPGRILKYDRVANQLSAEFLYWIEPVAEAPSQGGFATAGAVEILALDETTILVLERSFAVGAGNDIRLYEVFLDGATDIRTIDSLRAVSMDDIAPARKVLLLHVNKLGIEPDNLEGMTLGPPLPDGTSTLFLVADDNFNRATQVSQVLAFALRGESPAIHQIQGAGHRSPLEHDWVRGVTGVVTAVDPHPESGGFWMQVPTESTDESQATSDGLFVLAPQSGRRPGDLVHVDGGIREIGRPGALSVTQIEAGRLETVASGRPLPTPVVIGSSGRPPPAEIVDDDALERFDPCCDGIDFYESLEGMRVAVEQAVAVSGTSRFGEIAVVGDRGRHVGARTRQGGLLLRPGDANPERLLVDDRLAEPAPSTVVGDRFRAPLIGVLDYGFNNFRLQVESWPSALRKQTVAPATPDPRPSEDHLSVASFNVLNLDPLDRPERFARVAQSIVRELGSPDLIGLQEIQDDNGAQDEGIVSAARTLELLVQAIADAGGPRYDVRQIDPEPNADGGEPNGNIRVVWMFDPSRVEWTDRPGGGATASVAVVSAAAGQAALSQSPGRIAATHPAFTGDETRGWEGGRKCLAGELRFRGHRLFVANCHLKSKRGDEPLFGAFQPPRRKTEEQRSAQARQVLAFSRAVLSHEPDARILVLGDMNEHEFRGPMRVLTGNVLINLAERVPLPDRYSYNYNGNSQVLDHILASPALAERAAHVEFVHVNADFSERQRASDHDPIVAWFDLD